MRQAADGGVTSGSWYWVAQSSAGAGELAGAVAETARVAPPHPARRIAAQPASAILILT
jgi:hypothetical protein